MQIKILSFLLVFLASCQISIAQVSTYSPYSRYGIGTLNERATANQIGMGRVSSVWSDQYSINPDNPASYSLSARSIFQLDGSTQFLKISNSQQSENVSLSGLDDILIVLKKDGGQAAFALGLTKFSNSGYNSDDIQNLENIGDVTYTYRGEGGINRALLGYSYRILRSKSSSGLFEKADTSSYKNNSRYTLSAGVNLEYYFGQVIKIKETHFDDLSFFNTRETTTSLMKDFNLNLGVQGEFNLFENYKAGEIFVNRLDLLFGATFTLGKEMNTDIDGLTENFVFSGVETILDTVETVNRLNGSAYLPSKLGLGFGLKLTRSNSNQLFLLFDYKQRKWSDYYTNFGGVEESLGTFQDTRDLSIGLSFRPSDDVGSNLLALFDYKLGYRKSDTYLVINNTGIEEEAVSFGFSIPLRKSSSLTRIYLGTEIGVRGTNDNNLVKENFTNVSFGISFSPYLNYRWFQKKEYN